MRFWTEDDSETVNPGAAVFSKAEITALLEFGSKDQTRTTLWQLQIDRCHPSYGVGRAVTTDGCVLLILEPPHQRQPAARPSAQKGVVAEIMRGELRPRCYSDRKPRKFGVPRDSIEAWKRMLTKKSYELAIDCDSRGIVTAKVIESGLLISEMKAAAAIESAPFPPYEAVVPDFRPLDQQVVCYAQPWVDARLLKRFDLVQKATQGNDRRIKGFRMQLDPGKPRLCSAKTIDTGPIRFDVAGDPKVESWATGIVMPITHDADTCRPEHRELEPKPVPGLLTGKELRALVAWALYDGAGNPAGFGKEFEAAREAAEQLLDRSPEIVKELNEQLESELEGSLRT